MQLFAATMHASCSCYGRPLHAVTVKGSSSPANASPTPPSKILKPLLVIKARKIKWLLMVLLTNASCFTTHCIRKKKVS